MSDLRFRFTVYGPAPVETFVHMYFVTSGIVCLESLQYQELFSE